MQIAVHHRRSVLSRTRQRDDRSGVGLGVILGAGTVTAKDTQRSEFQKARDLSESLCPGRFMHHMLLDYAGWDDADWSERAVKQIDEGYRLGAAGLKEFKRLGLFLKDRSGALIRIDDPKLDSVYRRCGELAMPVTSLFLANRTWLHVGSFSLVLTTSHLKLGS